MLALILQRTWTPPWTDQWPVRVELGTRIELCNGQEVLLEQAEDSYLQVPDQAIIIWTILLVATA